MRERRRERIPYRRTDGASPVESRRAPEATIKKAIKKVHSARHQQGKSGSSRFSLSDQFDKFKLIKPLRHVQLQHNRMEKKKLSYGWREKIFTGIESGQSLSYKMISA